MAYSISTFPLFPLLLAFLSAPPCQAATPKVVERASKTCPIFRENLLDDVMFLQAANQDKVQVCRCLSNRTTNRFTYINSKPGVRGFVPKGGGLPLLRLLPPGRLRQQPLPALQGLQEEGQGGGRHLPSVGVGLLQYFLLENVC